MKLKYIKSYKIFESELPSDRLISAEDLLNKDFEKGLDFENKYKILFGKPAPNFSMMLFGQPGSGKTYFSLEFAYYLTNFGKVLYISSEEYGSVTLQDKLKDIIEKQEGGHKLKSNNLDKDNIKIPDNLFFAKGMIDLEDYNFIFIDSVNDLDIDIMDYKEIRDIYSKTAFISILQSTKEMGFRGGKSWEHEMDIAAEVENGVVKVYKNRYVESSELNSYDIFNDKMVVKNDIKNI